MSVRSAIGAVILAMTLGTTDLSAADSPPAYQIVLRSRSAQAVPQKTKDAQTGGGSILVEQVEPHTVIITMGGAAVVGSEFHGSSAGIEFTLDQDLEFIPTRQNVRAPRIGMVGRVVGNLVVIDPGKCGKGCGSDEQGPGIACLSLGDAQLLSVNVQTASVASGQSLALDYREGPVECGASTGCYRLRSTFRIAAAQGKGVFNRQAAVADFDPAPQLDTFLGQRSQTFSGCAAPGIRLQSDCSRR